jgi:hypothetical protein
LFKLSLFPDKDDIILTKEIESWSSFEYALREEDRELFKNRLTECYKYSVAINAKGEPFPTEPLIMALLLLQQKVIDWLLSKASKKGSITIDSE